MMTWNSVDLPDPVLPAISACWRVALPSSRYCIFVAPDRPMGMRISDAVSPVQISSGRGAICSNGTSTRVEFFALRPTACRNGVAVSGAGGASSSTFTPDRFQPASSKPLSVRSRLTLFCRSSSATKSCGAAMRWSQWMSVKTPQRAPLAAMLRSRRVALSEKFAGNEPITRK